MGKGFFKQTDGKEAMEKKLVTLFAFNGLYQQDKSLEDIGAYTISSEFSGEERERILSGSFADCFEMFLRRNEKCVCKNYDAIVKRLEGIIEYAQAGAKGWYYENGNGPRHVYIQCLGSNGCPIRKNGEYRHSLTEKVINFISTFPDVKEMEGIECLDMLLFNFPIFS